MTIQMNKVTAQAYREVLKHWRCMPDTAKKVGSDTCAFCRRFKYGCADINGVQCPINELVGNKHCVNTPYTAFDNHLDDVVGSDHMEQTFDDECPTCHILWKDQIEFLESLNTDISSEPTIYTWTHMTKEQAGKRRKFIINNLKEENEQTKPNGTTDHVLVFRYSEHEFMTSDRDFYIENKKMSLLKLKSCDCAGCYQMMKQFKKDVKGDANVLISNRVVKGLYELKRVSHGKYKFNLMEE